MDAGPAADTPSRRPLRTFGLALSAAVLFLAVWIPLHPSRPAQPTADVTTHLSVARHLVRGEGFLTDVAYPLSFAFDFARELPQPLIHRQPGFAVLLTGPVAAAGMDPARSLAYARAMQMVILGLTVLIGAAALLRRGLGVGIPAWLLLVGANPLLAYAVDWIFVELACGLVLLALWIRGRDGDPGPLDGLLAGVLAMMRLDLFWVPLLWWGVGGAFRPGRWRRPVLALLVMAAVGAPWAVRNLALTGHPFFSLQGHAELVKDTRAWPGYDVYRQLEPQPLVQTFVADPVPVLRKAARGVEFFVRGLGAFAPLPLILVFGVGLILLLVPGREFHPAKRERAGPLGHVVAGPGNRLSSE